MAIKVGDCFMGRITRIVPFGAFVALEECAGEGMIHISEMSPAFIGEISDCAAVGDAVLVKVLRIDDRGRIALSRRQAMTEEEMAAERRRFSTGGRCAPKETTHDGAVSCDFEEMLRRFRITSEETLTTLRRSAGTRRTRRKR